jgi:DNA invertase Pin-like site-specific DNA recombinase
VQKVYFLYSGKILWQDTCRSTKFSAKTTAKNKVQKCYENDKFLHMNTITSNRIGYARVSTIGQNLDSQLDALNRAECSRIFTDKASGTKENRPEWTKLMDFIRPGDMIVVTELSRMTRSLMHLLQLLQDFEEKGINLVSLREKIDTSTATGRAFVSIIGAINQMERELKAERAAAGRAAAKARGKTGGRPKTNPAKLEQARILYENSDHSAAAVSKIFGFSRRTFFNYLSATKAKQG